MWVKYLRAGLQFAGAITAMLAAIAWMRAARQPVAVQTPAYYGVTEEDLKPHNDQIQRGAALNSKAATWAAWSAGFQAVVLLIPDL
jgi:hypothetical protein